MFIFENKNYRKGLGMKYDVLKRQESRLLYDRYHETDTKYLNPNYKI